MPYVYDANIHRNTYVTALPVSGAVSGSTVSANFTAAEKAKLAGIAANADVNVSNLTLEEIIAYTLVANMGGF